MLKLGMNIDHVATLRQARYREAHGGMTPEPDPVEAARQCIAAGAHSITAHLREDRRHIQDADVWSLRRDVSAPLNLEMAVTDAMTAFALELKPAEVCLVPESRQEVTTEGGLDVAGKKEAVAKAVQILSSAGIIVSLFIDPDPVQIAVSKEVGAPCIELHTGQYANAGAERQACLDRLRAAAVQAHGLGLQVNAGHGLHYDNLAEFLATPHLDTLNIGHAIVSRAIFTGIGPAVRDLLVLMKEYRG